MSFSLFNLFILSYTGQPLSTMNSSDGPHFTLILNGILQTPHVEILYEVKVVLVLIFFLLSFYGDFAVKWVLNFTEYIFCIY